MAMPKWFNYGRVRYTTIGSFTNVDDLRAAATKAYERYGRGHAIGSLYDNKHKRFLLGKRKISYP